ncbi:MAG TPA: DJ-1/PfpI family protein [Saprospiraceae bacterium]|nr:DJ-1/PfpI family protein [Saprospiraceae bacterium]
MQLKHKTYLVVIVLFLIIIRAFAQTSSETTVAILVFDRVQIIDFTGPWETFGQAGYRVFTVSESKDTVKTRMGMNLIPDYKLDEAPDAHILVIPGGGIPHNLNPDHPIINWLKEKEKSSKYILTVCNGAFVLGPSGFSDGLSMTTNAGMINHLTHFVKGAVAVYDQRFVHDGKFISAGGLTAGIDASLYLISLIDSKGRAQEVANNMEYHWDTTNNYVRTKLADFELSMALDFNPPLRKKVLKYEGDENKWLADFLVTRTETLEDFAKQLEEAAEHQRWKLNSEARKKSKIHYEWTYNNHRSEKWKLNAVFSTTEINSEYRLTINLERI